MSNTAHNEGRIGETGGDSDDNDVEQENSQVIKNIDDDSEADNQSENQVNIEDSDDNDVDQSNDQSIEDVDDDSSARNSGGNRVNIS